jgi:hypothetical protein
MPKPQLTPHQKHILKIANTLGGTLFQLESAAGSYLEESDEYTLLWEAYGLLDTVNDEIEEILSRFYDLKYQQYLYKDKNPDANLTEDEKE